MQLAGTSPAVGTSASVKGGASVASSVKSIQRCEGAMDPRALSSMVQV